MMNSGKVSSILEPFFNEQLDFLNFIGILNGDSDEILPTEVLPNEQFTTLPDSD